MEILGWKYTISKIKCLQESQQNKDDKGMSQWIFKIWR
jgi:hypothetical protein